VPALLTPDINRPQVWKAYKRILRYTRREGLRNGDRLPSQPELGKTLGLVGSTFRAAMTALETDGAVVSRQKVGTTIADDHLISRVPWTIGVTTINVTEQPLGFGAELFLRILAALSRAGARPVVYQRTKQALGRFHGLADDIAEDNIDGLVTLTPVDAPTSEVAARRQMPICHTHWWKGAKSGVLVDQKTWAERAVTLLAARGCRKIAATDVFSEVPDTEDRAGNEFRDGFIRGLRAAGLPDDKGRPLAFTKDYDRHVQLRRAAPYLVQLLLRRPAAQRPDALVISDDYVAAHLALILRERSDYRPMLAVQTNRQVPRVFSLPVIAFEVDIEALATQTVNLLIDRLCNPSTPDRIEWYVPLEADPKQQLSPLSISLAG